MKRFLVKLSHIIIPHEKNKNIPHILKEEFVLILVIFAGILFYFNQNNFSIIKNLHLSATVYPAVLADLANKDRLTSGVPGLAWSSTLENAAKLKAQDMLQNGYFAHISPDGVTPWYWLSEVDYNFIYAGENLAIDFTESENVERAWINSPKHKENILNSHFTEIGIATIDGLYKGKNTTFVVEFFGNPLKANTATKPNLDKNVATKNIKEVGTPLVAGASTENIKIIEETDKFIIVKNNTEKDSSFALSINSEVKTFSTWYEHLIVSPTKIIRIIYVVILILILVAMLLVLSKEYKRHHTKHLVLGLVLIIAIAILLYCISIK